VNIILYVLIVTLYSDLDITIMNEVKTGKIYRQRWLTALLFLSDFVLNLTNF